ncbi:unnamed protein product [Chironomus riparius]|uniref:F-box domain-containing protein n=1 Tax=Chironomus riparius TaxID=315576 RepID=A0A9N9S4H7_9DIPT|nr:unnamed protein product [Chironomus riparius]
MLKRQSKENKMKELNKKIQKTSLQKVEKIHHLSSSSELTSSLELNLAKKLMQSNAPHLPLEIIRDTVLYLTSFKDILSMSILSQEIRSMIFGVPDVMKKIRINFSNDINFEDGLMFLKIRGKYIRNMNFEPIWGSLQCLNYIWKFVPNLEELSIKTFESEADKVAAVMNEINNKLECNRQDVSDLTDLQGCGINLKKIRILSIDALEVDDKEILTNLIVQQKNLKELTINIVSVNDPVFPCRDVSLEVAFKLKTLKLSIPNINQELFINFLNTQTQNLEELDISSTTNHKIFEFIFENFKNLKKFTIDENGSDIILDNRFPDLKLENLKYFHDKNQNGTIVIKLFVRFPNIETLKCCDTMQATGTYPKLTTLDVSEVYWPRIRNLKLPNLKNLFIKKIDKCDDDYYWTHFAANFLNVENITVEKVGYENKDVLRFVKNLKLFTKLKTFKLRHGTAVNHDYKLNENEQVDVENIFYKILIDTTKKTVKSSSHIVQNSKMIQKTLLKTFKGFKFYEFCFPQLKVLRINYVI